MSDDETKWPDQGQNEDGEAAQSSDEQDAEMPEELPASVIFMEMMRRAAGAATTQTGKEDGAGHNRTEKPPIIRHQRPSPPPLSRSPEATQQDNDQKAGVNSPRQRASEREHTQNIEQVDEAASDQPNSEAAVTVEPEPIPHKRPLTDEERRQQTMMEAQRVQRVKRRQQKRRARNVGIIGGLVRSFFVVFVSAGLMATILSWWTNSDFLRPEMRRSLQVALATGQAPTAIPTTVPTPNWLRTIGIVSGHSGPGLQASYDPGAVCADGLTENEINFSVASRVVDELRRQGYRAELLEEFDARLDNYQAEALISIHANTCAEFVGGASGFIVAKAASRAEDGEDTRLAECVAAYYEPMSGLARRFETTIDMTDYHSFREIHPLTPAAIIELGFMRDDRAVLTDKPDILSAAIVEGILCYINREIVRPNALTATPELPTPALEETPVSTPIGL